MRWLLTFSVTVATSMLLLLWRGDFNLYVYKEHKGLWLLKDEADLASRIVISFVLSIAYGGVNTLMLYFLHKWILRRPMRVAQTMEDNRFKGSENKIE